MDNERAWRANNLEQKEHGNLEPPRGKGEAIAKTISPDRLKEKTRKYNIKAI